MAAKEAIVILRRAAAGDSLDEPSESATEREVAGATVVPLMQTGEETFAGQIVTADFFVKLPADTDILATDRVRIRGEACEVQGAPADYGRKGILFQARRVGSV